MWGQWGSRINLPEDHTGHLLLNVDRLTPTRGRLHVDIPRGPGAFPIRTSWLINIQEGRTSIANFLPNTLTELSFVFTSDRRCEVTFAAEGISRVTHSMSKLDDFAMPISIAHRVSQMPQLEKIFDEMAARPRDSAIYRGQASNQWALTSRFHRLDRRDLMLFQERDLRAFFDFASSIGLPVSIATDSDAESLIHLAQHHGVPTPWIDWTFSPHVALFFALSECSPAEGALARVYSLQLAGMGIGTLGHGLDIGPAYLRILRPVPRHNQRSFAQRGAVMATNLARPDYYLDHLSRQAKAEITLFDIDTRLRSQALRWLSDRNINARTLFGDLDGAANEIRHRYSDPGWDLP